MTSELKYQTKQQRLIALIDGYQEAFGKKAVTTTEVAIWATAKNLWPVPTRFDPPSQCLAWEIMLREAIHEAKNPRPSKDEIVSRLRVEMRRIEQGKHAKPQRRGRKRKVTRDR